MNLRGKIWKLMPKYFFFINFGNPLYILSKKGGPGGALPVRLEIWFFLWYFLYPKGMGLALELIYTRFFCILDPPNVHGNLVWFPVELFSHIHFISKHIIFNFVHFWCLGGFGGFTIIFFWLFLTLWGGIFLFSSSLIFLQI